MTRAAWIVAVAIISGTLTAVLVRAQLARGNRDDSSGAQVKLSSMAVGAAYAESPIRSDGIDLLPIGSEPVADGKEFVILQVTVNGLVDSKVLSTLNLESRYPAPNYERSPIILARLALAHPEDSERIYSLDFPDGTIVVDSGRMPWISTAHIEHEPDAPAFVFPAISVLGYFREKIILQ